MNNKIKKKYTSQFKSKAVLELLKEEKSIAQLSSEFGIHSSVLHRWKASALANFHKLFEEDSSYDTLKSSFEKKEKDLYSQIGKLTTYLEWIKKKSGLDPEQGS